MNGYNFIFPIVNVNSFVLFVYVCQLSSGEILEVLDFFYFEVAGFSDGSQRVCLWAEAVTKKGSVVIGFRISLS